MYGGNLPVLIFENTVVKMILDSLDGLHTIVQYNLSTHAEYCVIEYKFRTLLNFAPLQMWTPYSCWVNFPLFIFLCVEFSAAAAAVFLNLPDGIQNSNDCMNHLLFPSLFSIHHTTIIRSSGLLFLQVSGNSSWLHTKTQQNYSKHFFDRCHWMCISAQTVYIQFTNRRMN